ncbi:hypothetical protein F3Y22_tig00010050pilonHSYRG00024 [Hibiscus syriacus]|uniref:RRM domain-containing protein n=1 Tax=Hibiscus syriacus TaxID=106335 RepID=A0A6A3C801_HIBSY|nr:hypothetical protein F3Y22_tig00010050pilonHSYRG00024 [Hibiscus syriacus]
MRTWTIAMRTCKSQCDSRLSQCELGLSQYEYVNRNTIVEVRIAIVEVRIAIVEGFGLGANHSAKLDRHRGYRYGDSNNHDSYFNNSNPYRAPSRFSDASPMSRYKTNNDANSDSNDKFDAQDPYLHHRSSPSNFRGGHHPFDSPPLQTHNSGGVGGGGGFRPIGGGSGGGEGGGFRPMAGGFEGNYQQPPPHPVQQTYTGQKRPFPFPGRGGEPPNKDRFGSAGSGGNFAKLFVGSVPKTAREEDIQHVFQLHGDVIEVALIKDKKTGQPQGNGECCFSAKSCVKCYFDWAGNEEDDGTWDNIVWTGVAPPRVETFVWQAAHQRVATLLDFIIVWNDLIPKSTIWKFIPRAVLWTVWKCRNDIIFGKEKVDGPLLFFLVRFRIASWFVARFNDVQINFDSLVGDPSLADRIHTKISKKKKVICWSPPPHDFFKFNVDGAVRGDGLQGGIGGVLKDSNCSILASFSMAVGPGPPMLAELKAIKQGIDVFLSSEWETKGRLILESDCRKAVDWILIPISAPTFCSSLVEEIGAYVSARGFIINWIPRSCNWEADKLAKEGIG